MRECARRMLARYNLVSKENSGLAIGSEVLDWCPLLATVKAKPGKKIAKQV